MQGQIGAPTLLNALALSIAVFKPEWQARVHAGPRSALVGLATILLLIAFVGFAGVVYR
jgi:hypothetical protein